MTAVGDVTSSMTAEDGFDDLTGEVAVAQVRTRAPEARFGRFMSRPVSGHPDWVQVNRVDSAGHVLRGGWTYLVNMRTSKVVRATGDPDALEFNSAVRSGNTC